jgi:hypothetical protein
MRTPASPNHADRYVGVRWKQAVSAAEHRL